MPRGFLIKRCSVVSGQDSSTVNESDPGVIYDDESWDAAESADPTYLHDGSTETTIWQCISNVIEKSFSNQQQLSELEAIAEKVTTDTVPDPNLDYENKLFIDDAKYSTGQSCGNPGISCEVPPQSSEVPSPFKPSSLNLATDSSTSTVPRVKQSSRDLSTAGNEYYYNQASNFHLPRINPYGYFKNCFSGSLKYNKNHRRQIDPYQLNRWKDFPTLPRVNNAFPADDPRKSIHPAWNPYPPPSTSHLSQCLTIVPVSKFSGNNRSYKLEPRSLNSPIPMNETTKVCENVLPTGIVGSGPLGCMHHSRVPAEECLVRGNTCEGVSRLFSGYCENLPCCQCLQVPQTQHHFCSADAIRPRHGENLFGQNLSKVNETGRKHPEAKLRRSLYQRCGDWFSGTASSSGGRTTIRSPNASTTTEMERSKWHRLPFESVTKHLAYIHRSGIGNVSGSGIWNSSGYIRDSGIKNDGDRRKINDGCEDCAVDPAFDFFLSTEGEIEARAMLDRIENKLGDYICQLCSERFQDAFCLARHRCSRIELVEFECRVCQKMFSSPANLASHRRWHKPDTTKPKPTDN